MSSGFAFTIALLFCAYAYYAESRRQVPISVAIWIPTLWMIRCASRGIDAWVYGRTAQLSGISLDQIFLFSTAIAGFIVLYRRRQAVSGLLKNNRAIVFFYVYMAVSLAWSPVPADSGRQMFRALGDLAMACILATEAVPLEAIVATCRRMMILLLPMSAVLSKYYPEVGRTRSTAWEPDMWIGVATHKNTLGQLLLVAGFALFFGFFRAVRSGRFTWLSLPAKAPLDFIFFCLILYLLNGGGAARSSTSVAVFVFTIGLLFLTQYFRENLRGLAFLVMITLSGAAVTAFASEALFGLSLPGLFAVAIGKDPTLAGRTDLWHDVFDIARAHPLQGSGFAGFWTTSVEDYLVFERHHWWHPHQAHNGYLETYIQLGLIGVTLLLVLIITSIRDALRRMPTDFPFHQFRLALLIAAVVHNYSEASFPRPTHLIWFTFLLVAICPLARQVGPVAPRFNARELATSRVPS